MTSVQTGPSDVRPQPNVEDGHQTVSVIIPTKNRRDDLLETLKAMVKQTCLPEEVVIIDQTASSCEPDVTAIMGAAPQIRLKYVWAPEIKGLVAARVRGIELASAEIVFFIDDDITMEEHCLENLKARYRQHPEVVGICGVDVGGADVPWWLVLARRAYMLGPFRDERSMVNKRHRQLSQPIRARLISGGLMSYRRWLFREFELEGDLWGHRWNGANDFSYRVSQKYTLFIDPTVRVLHRKPYGDYSPEDFVRVRVSGTFFLFARNIQKDFIGWVTFLWVLVAIFVRSVWRGIQSRALGLTVRTFFTEVRKGFVFLKHPFKASY